MKKHCIIFFGIIFYTTFIIAQNVESTLSIYNTNFPQEKIHIQTDKETYFSGETIWFKAYILADNVPTTISTNLYIYLVNEQGKIIEDKTMPIYAATADGHFTLPDSSANKYKIIALTKWMLNFDSSFIFNKTITVFNKNNVTNLSTTPEINLQFFAESGNIIAEKYNYIAYKATQNNSLPYNINAAIKNSKNILIDSITSVHDGMGVLKMYPDENEIYFAEWVDNKGEFRKTFLPKVQPQGVLLHTQQLQNKLYYLITIKGEIEAYKELNLLATMNQRIVYKANFKMTQNEINQIIDTKEFETGILQLTVFDKNNNPLAERIVFINNENFSFKTNVNIDEKSTNKRGKNKITIEIPDTLSSNLSLSVLDANIENVSTNQNIYTNLLLQGDLKGFVYNAEWYFNNNTQEAKNYLDLVMQTNGWRRYNWEKIYANEMPSINYPKDNYLTILGKAADVKQNGVANQIINLIVQSKDSTKQWYLPITNKEGIFKQEGIVFYDTASILYKLNDSKEKSIGVGIANNYNGLLNKNDIKNKSFFLKSNFINENYKYNLYTEKIIKDKQINNPLFEQNGKTLNEIVVKSNNKRYNWKNDPIQKMDEKYTTTFVGLSASSYGFDVLHDETASNKVDIYDYLIGKVPGLSIKYVNTEKVIMAPSFKSSSEQALIFINENEAENSFLSTLRLEDIAYIKFLSTTPWRQGFPPSICIYLTKGNDLKEAAKKQISTLTKIKMEGYSIVKQFYSPDYSTITNNLKPDFRTTLLWVPYILTNKENKKTSVTFYNNDVATKLKIIIEGINEEGKLIHVEKFIE